MTAPTARLIMLTAAALAGTATGRPQLQHCDMLSDYEKSVLAQFFPAAAAAPNSAPEPTVLDYEGSVSPRSSRSNADEKTDFAAVDPLLQSAASPAQGRNYYFGYMERAPTARSTGPPHACGETTEAVARPRAINETAAAVLPSAAAFEKLTAYYEQLKAQQEMLARQQFQQQLYEQQQRRQQQFVLMQQQIRQQYYQQQEQAMMMFDRLRKNPDFVKQLAAFVDQKRGEALPDKTGGNEAQAAAAAPGAPEARAASAPRAADKKKSGEMGPQQTVAADRADEELAAGDAFAAVKRVDARRAEQPGARSEDEQAEDEDEPPVLKKAYSPVFE